MSDYVVSARKYRPQTFDSVVGQANITETLAKAIEKNQLGSAFLFCGPRGVGKTTCARILAREVNLFHSDNPEEDHNFAFNIFELDAASNNGVEAIRDLIDQVRIPPQTGKFKVYIIDEVHMLSTPAFNAFLKTLEEPPPYAIFIMATTEKHKILPTIISRCQVFDFNRIKVGDIVDHLKKIAASENIEAESDALHVIAEKADGALRDALSIFDRMVSFSGNNINYEAVVQNLNILDHDYFFRVVEATLAGDRPETLLTFDEIVQAGFEGQHFVSGLANHLRNLLMATSPKTANIIETGKAIKTRYLEQAALCTTDQLVAGLDVFGTVETQYKTSQNQRLLVEIALLKLCGLFESGEKKNHERSDKGRAATAPKKDEPNKSPASRSAPEAAQASNEVPTIADNSNVKPTAEKSSAVNESSTISADPDMGNPPGKSGPSAEPTSLVQTGEVEPLPEGEISKTAMGGDTVKEPTRSYPKRDDKPKGKNLERPTDAIGGKSGAPPLSNLGRTKLKGVPSLSDLRGGEVENKNHGNQAEEGSSKVDEAGPEEPFNLAALWAVWDAYADTIKAKDMQSYHATLTKNRPVVREENHIEFLVDNHVQLAHLEEDRQHLLEYLRTELQNRKVQLKGIIAESEDEGEGNLYDPKQKYEAMNRSNPALGKLRSSFDLDVEHDG